MKISAVPKKNSSDKHLFLLSIYYVFSKLELSRKRNGKRDLIWKQKPQCIVGKRGKCVLANLTLY